VTFCVFRAPWVFEWDVFVLEDGVLLVVFFMALAVLFPKLFAGLVALELLLLEILLFYVANDNSLNLC
jgi:hypothetical protein